MGNCNHFNHFLRGRLIEWNVLWVSRLKLYGGIYDPLFSFERAWGRKRKTHHKRDQGNKSFMIFVHFRCHSLLKHIHLRKTWEKMKIYFWIKIHTSVNQVHIYKSFFWDRKCINRPWTSWHVHNKWNLSIFFL